MLGGPYAFGSGDWHLSDLLAPLYPAEIPGRYDLQPVGVEKAVKLQPTGSIAKGLDWTKPPVVLWQHVMKAKPNATVHGAAAGSPLALTRPYGKGKVGFVTAAPLGDAPAGELAFWDWPQWPRLLGAVIRDLLSIEGKEVPERGEEWLILAQWGNNTERTAPVEVEGQGRYPDCGRHEPSDGRGRRLRPGDRRSRAAGPRAGRGRRRGLRRRHGRHLGGVLCGPARGESDSAGALAEPRRHGDQRAGQYFLSTIQPREH